MHRLRPGPPSSQGALEVGGQGVQGRRALRGLRRLLPPQAASGRVARAPQHQPQRLDAVSRPLVVQRLALGAWVCRKARCKSARCALGSSEEPFRHCRPADTALQPDRQCGHSKLAPAAFLTSGVTTLAGREQAGGAPRRESWGCPACRLRALSESPPPSPRAELRGPPARPGPAAPLSRRPGCSSTGTAAPCLRHDARRSRQQPRTARALVRQARHAARGSSSGPASLPILCQISEQNHQGPPPKMLAFPLLSCARKGVSAG
jgi:hypothetical protein